VGWLADCPTHACLAAGGGASAALQFIVDRWDALPATTVFLHAHGRAAAGACAVLAQACATADCHTCLQPRPALLADAVCAVSQAQRGQRCLIKKRQAASSLWEVRPGP